ncbi:GntR family transcriptional regulator [Labrys neptuniae]
MSLIEMQPNEMGSLSARIYNKLREGLIAGNFAPGQRLLMQDLAQQLGTSVTPVREACLRLVSEQALELRSGRFVTVPDLTRERYWQIRLIRIALEGLAAELAVEHVTPEDIVKLRATHELFAAADKAGEADRARHYNREFHFGVYRLSRIPMLVGQIESLWISMGPILNVLYRVEENDYVGAEEHLTLLEALETGKKKAARAALERDIVRGGVNLLKYFDRIEGKAG